MAVLRLNDINDSLYEALKQKAKNRRHSIRQEVIMMIESYISVPSRTNAQATEEFLNLSWSGDESAEQLIEDIRRQRSNSNRFEDTNDLFD